MKPEKPTQRDANQGEGDRLSARRYNREVREFVADGQVEPAAREAEAFVAHKPAEAARAERRARRGPQSSRISIDELVAKGQTVVDRMRPVVDRVRPVVDRAVGRLRARFARR
jgi:hypothetical protein